jgi:hypothetical protein
MLQCETGEETKNTVHVHKKEQLQSKMVISKEKPVCTIMTLAGLTTSGSSAAMAITSQMTP